MAPLRLLVVGYLVLDAAALALGLTTLVARFAFWPSIFVHGDALTALSAITLVVAGVGLVLGLRLKRHGSVLPLAAVLAICSATIYGIVFLVLFRTRGHELLAYELLVNRPSPIVQNETQNPYLHQYAVSLSMPGSTPSRAIDEAYCIHEGKVFCDTLPLRVTGGGLADGNRTSWSSLNASSTSLALEGLVVSPNLTLNAYCALRRNAVQVIDAGIEAACAGCEGIMAATSDPLHLAPALRRLCPMREGDAAFGVFCAMYMSDRVEGYQLHYAPGRWYRYHGLRSMVQMPNGCYKALAQDADRYVTPLQITAGMLAWTTTTIAIGLWQWQRRRFLLATTNADDYVLAYRSVGTPSVYRD